MPTNGGPPSADAPKEKHPFGGVVPTACGRCRVHSPKKIRLLHETQLFYGESHVGSRQIFPSFPSVSRCAARERNPVPPFAPHRGSEHRGLRRDGEICHGFGEMVHRFDTMCPHGGKSLPRGGNGCPRGSRCYPSIRCFGERFHRRRCANPDACRGRRYSRGHDDLGQRAFRYFRPAFRTPLCDSEKTCGGRRYSRAHDDLGQRAFRYFRPAFRTPLCDNEKTCRGDGRPLGRTAAAAVAAGVVLRSADDRTALFTQWLAPHLPMVRGLVRRHTYFAGERADDYQTAVLHLLEHLDDLAHFALCLTARRDTAKQHAATANAPAPADELSAQPTTQVARDFDETRAAVDESEIYLDEHAPHLYASAAEIDESQCGGDEMQPTDDEALRAIDTAAVAFDAMTDADDEALREVNETRTAADEDLCEIDTATGNFAPLTDADDETLRGGDEPLHEVDETAVVFDETADEDATSAAAEDERQLYADAAPDEAEQTPAPLPVTAEEVLRTVGPFNPRPWLAGVTLRLLSTLNHRALRHRETHLTPASVDCDELFDPADPDGGLWAVGANPATADAQRQAAPSRWEETLGAGRERTGGSAGVTTRDAAATRAAQAVAARSATADSDAPPAGAEAAAAAEGAPTAAGEWACSAVDNCLECWHREQPRRGFHRTRGGRLWNAMRARAQQAHSAFAYRTVLRADAAEALAAQPLRDRALVLLTADGWTAEEIGLAVGASPTAVRQTVCRVRMRLRRWRRAWAHRTHATRAL